MEPVCKIREMDPLKIAALVAIRAGEKDGKAFYSLCPDSIAAEGLLSKPRCVEPNRPQLIQSLLNKKLCSQAALDLRTHRSAGIEFLPISDPLFPKLLKNIFKPPVGLFFRGSVELCLDELPMISIVGSRRADQNGCQIAEAFASELSSFGACIVSGLAYGIDSAAHKGALKKSAPLPTIAVLGNGLSSIYPSCHNELAAKIVAQGGILFSQFEPHEKPYPSNFLNRNRIIAGLSQGVVVIQATARSGSLATARFALEEGREVMCVPGSIIDPRYEGSNKLIKEGAYLVTSAEDIAELLPAVNARRVEALNASNTDADDNFGEHSLLRFLKERGQISLADLKDGTKKNSDLHIQLLELELAGKIVRLPGNQIALAPR